ncbi:MAG: 50S ribosomal protein L7Ae/L30e/S12e/Gadd45 [Firmicutes bacterium RBG_13_65_8]|nr:MAG: 50S ribosomal protein L7Ae/L30e/S12e/Gadd45 [Firmicutes bacterium RBG_13_65_8]
MPERLRAARSRHVGAKQTLKAMESGKARVVYLARDAETRITGPVIRRAGELGVEIVYVETMRDLGRLCGIEVGAASAAIIGG